MASYTIILGSSVPFEHKDLALKITRLLKDHVFDSWDKGVLENISIEAFDKETWDFKFTFNNPEVNSSHLDEAAGFINGFWRGYNE